MTVLELRDRLITDGIASVKRHETTPERIRGGIAGFNLCSDLFTPQAYQLVLQERHAEERRMISEYYAGQKGESKMTNYWEYRIATVQVEFVWDRLAVAWAVGGTYSARAALHVNQILKGTE